MVTMAPHILLIPYPAQGHLLPLLDLAHHLSTHNITITIAVTTANRPLLTPLLELSPSITPLVLPFPSHPDIPAGIENTQHLPPGAFLTLMPALSLLHEPLLQWARSHPSPPTAIISDMFAGWTYSLAKEMNIPRLVFSPSGAVAISVINSCWLNMPRNETGEDSYPVVFPEVPGKPVYPWHQMSMVYRSYKEGEPVWELLKKWFLDNINSWGYIINTFDALEGKYLSFMQTQLCHDRVWAVGPLAAPTAAERGGPSPTTLGVAEIVSWLDRFHDGSVLYVCFGSQAVLTLPQAAALGAALERSGVRFVWCVKKDAFVPEGLAERVEGRGMVIKGWAPQVAVLRHKAVGWFLTHCGWNSTLEALSAGVAMLTWPMTADQFMNARLLEEEGVGVKVCEGKDAVPEVEKLADVMKRAVEGGETERERVSELMRKAAEAVQEGGSSYRDMQELVEVLSKMKCEEEIAT